MPRCIRDSLVFEDHVYCECHCHHDKNVAIADISPEKFIVLFPYNAAGTFLVHKDVFNFVLHGY